MAKENSKAQADFQMVNIFPANRVYAASKIELWHVYKGDFNWQWTRGHLGFTYDSNFFGVPAFRRRVKKHTLYFIMHEELDKLYTYWERHNKHNLTPVFKKEISPNSSSEYVDISEMQGSHITISRGRSYEQIIRLSFMYDQCYTMVRNCTIPFLRCWDSKLYISGNVWDNLPQSVKDQFRPVIKQKQSPKDAYNVNIHDSKGIHITIQGERRRSYCSRWVTLIDGSRRWTIPCSPVSDAGGIEVPFNLFKSLPDVVVKVLIKNSRLSDPLNLLSQSQSKNKTSKDPVIKSPPSSEVVSSNSIAAAYFSETFIDMATKQLPDIWKLWQKSRQVFIFEEELSRSLLSNVDAVKSVRCETISCIPYSSCYIVGDGADVEFFASMQGSTLCLQRIKNDQSAEAYTINLPLDGTVKDCLSTVEEMAMRKSLMEMLQLYACLCIAETETLPAVAASKKAPKKPSAATQPSSAPTWDNIYTVTMRHTSTTSKRKDMADSEHAARRPHKRKAHWHNYWIGKKSEPESRKLERRWVAEISVNSTDVELPVRIVLINRSSFPSLI